MRSSWPTKTTTAFLQEFDTQGNRRILILFTVKQLLLRSQIAAKVKTVTLIENNVSLNVSEVFACSIFKYF